MKRTSYQKHVSAYSIHVLNLFTLKLIAEVKPPTKKEIREKSDKFRGRCKGWWWWWW